MAIQIIEVRKRKGCSRLSLKKMKIGIRAKFVIGFAIVLLLMIGIIVTVYLMEGRIEDANKHAFHAMEEVIITREKEVDHLNFINQLSDSLMERTRFPGQLDHTKCSFGSWYYSKLDSDHFLEESPEYQELFLALEDPHRRVHQGASKIVALFDSLKGLSEEEEIESAWREAEQLYREEILESVAVFRNHLSTFREQVYKEMDMMLAEAEQTGMLVRRAMVIMAAVSLVLGIGIAFYLAVSITRPVVYMTRVAQKIAEGDFTVQVKLTNRKDEIGKLAVAFTEMTEGLRELIRKAMQITTDVSRSVGEVSRSVEATSASIEQVAASAGQFAGSTQHLSSNAQEMAGLSADISAKAEEGEKAVLAVTEQMSEINRTFEELHSSIEELGSRSEQIGTIVNIISNVARQTNLLALNAAIEAARAGEHGRGFAVVAEEVRKLAEQTTRAAEEIAGLIEATQEETAKAMQKMNTAAGDVKKGTDVVLASGKTFQEIMDGVERISGSVQEVSAAAEELSAGSQQVAASTEEQSAAIQEISATMEQLRTMVEELFSAMQRFKYE